MVGTGVASASAFIGPPARPAWRGIDERQRPGEAKANGCRSSLPRPLSTDSHCLGSRRTPIAGAVCAFAVPLALGPSVAGQPRRLHVTVRQGIARAVVRQLLADPAERAVAGYLVGQLAGAQVVEQLVDAVELDAVEVAVVHLHAWGLAAGRDALDLLERELAVGRGAARLDAEPVLEVVEKL